MPNRRPFMCDRRRDLSFDNKALVICGFRSSHSDEMTLAVGFSPWSVVASNRRRVATVENHPSQVNRRYATTPI